MSDHYVALNDGIEGFSIRISSLGPSTLLGSTNLNCAFRTDRALIEKISTRC